MSDETTDEPSADPDAALRRFLDPDFLETYRQIESIRRHARDRAADEPHTVAAIALLGERPRLSPSVAGSPPPNPKEAGADERGAGAGGEALPEPAPSGEAAPDPERRATTSAPSDPGPFEPAFSSEDPAPPALDGSPPTPGAGATTAATHGHPDGDAPPVVFGAGGSWAGAPLDADVGRAAAEHVAPSPGATANEPLREEAADPPAASVVFGNDAAGAPTAPPTPAGAPLGRAADRPPVAGVPIAAETADEVAGFLAPLGAPPDRGVDAGPRQAPDPGWLLPPAVTEDATGVTTPAADPRPDPSDRPPPEEPATGGTDAPAPDAAAPPPKRLLSDLTAARDAPRGAPEPPPAAPSLAEAPASGSPPEQRLGVAFGVPRSEGEQERPVEPPVWDVFAGVLDEPVPPRRPPAVDREVPTFDLGTPEEQAASLARRAALRDERELPGIVFPPGPAEISRPAPREVPGIVFPPGPASARAERPRPAPPTIDLGGVAAPPPAVAARPAAPSRRRRRTPDDEGALPKRRDRRSEILARLAGGPASAQELAEEYGISREGVLRWLRLLESDGKVRQTAQARTSRINKWVLVEEEAGVDG